MKKIYHTFLDFYFFYFDLIIVRKYINNLSLTGRFIKL